MERDINFAPYKESLDMEELGFELIRNDSYSYYDKLTRDLYFSQVDEEANYIVAPLYQQAFRWFREKYGINSYILPDPSFEFRIIDRDHCIESFKTYEKAELACLRKLINIVKENNGKSILSK